MTARPESPQVDQRLDPEIAPLVEELRQDQHVVTLGSCCGHGKDRASIDLAVHGFEGLRRFVTVVNRVDRAVRDEALLEVTLNWDEEVVTACDFRLYPDWIMLSLAIEGPDGAPTAALLGRIARAYQAATMEFRPSAAARLERIKDSSVKVGRNAPCPCGSGLKYKKCCLGKKPAA